MKILAIETATEACSVALILNDQLSDKLVSRFQLAPREHTKLILPMMDEVLEEANVDLKDLSAIAFSRGPGAFTGLRIASGVAQGVALSVNIPVVAVSTLSALALQAHLLDKTAKIIIAALDARMGEVYWAIFKIQDSNIILKGEEKVSKPELMLEVALSKPEESITIIGTGWDAYAEALFEEAIPSNIRYLKQQYPQADAIAKLAVPLFKEGKAVAPENAQPVYIRNKVAEKSKNLPEH